MYYSVLLYVKELQSSKSSCKKLLLAATATLNFVVFRCLVPKKWHENISPYNGESLEKRPNFVPVRKKTNE